MAEFIHAKPCLRLGPLLHKVQASPEQRNSEQSTHPPNTQDLTRRLKTPVAPLVQNAAIFEKRVAHHA